jgi:glucokinase-like ROK family protein
LDNRRATADQMLVRKHNTAIILDCLRRNAPLSRADLSNRTGLNRSTVSSIVHELIRQHLVRETELQKIKLGRPGMALELSPDGACAIGAEVGVDFISILLADFVAQPIWRKRIAINSKLGQSAFMECVGDALQEALAQAQAHDSRPLGIGVGVPGLVDVVKGELKFAPNLKWSNLPLREILMGRFDIPVFVENDANAAALGEYYFGVAREAENFIYLNAAVGLGGGIVLGGKLFRGSGGYAGEVGHISVDVDGELCGCGRRGCWELMVGPRAVVRQIRTTLRNGAPSLISELAGNDLESITFGQVIEAAEAGDAVARDALREVGKWLGIGIANLVNVFNPELVVLGGALAQAWNIVIPVIQATVQEQAMQPSQQVLKIATSAHGSEACAVGAAALVLDEILRYPLA